VTAGHSCHDSCHSTTHHHMELRLDFVAEEGRDRDCIHGELLLEISEDFHSLGINNLRAIVSCSGQNSKVFAEVQRIDFGAFVNKFFVEDISLEVIVDDPAITGSQEKSFVIHIPQGSCCDLVGLCIVKDDLEVSQSRDFLDRFLISCSRVEDCLEIKDFDPGRRVWFVFVVEEQESF
jgi:hypothetical protein